MEYFAKRRANLLRRLRREQASAILVTRFVNVTYLTGFTGDDSYLLLTPERALMLSDSRYAEQLQEQCPDLELQIRRTPATMTDAIRKAVKASGLTHLAYEADAMTVAEQERLREALPAVQWCPTSGLLDELRAVKDKQEIARIRHSLTLAERAFEVIRAGLRAEQTEAELAAALEYQIRQFGGQGCAFPPIVAVGPRAALPHAFPTDRPVGASPLMLVDWGATAEQYRSDLTRILVTSRISPKLERIYGVVLTAQERAIAAVRPGARLGEVDAAARQVIADAGHGKHFGHGLGHGFGLEIHESPRLAPRQRARLEAGMVITIEPGVYLPGWGGIRIEDDVLVTPDGCEVLSRLPKQLEDCVARPL